jgi:PA14 domain/Domain of unknown function (DUF1929)/Kelch motif
MRLLAAAILAVVSSNAGAQSAAAMGAWSGPVAVPVVAIHLQLLPDGSVMAWGKPETPPLDGRGPLRLWDPTLALPTFHEVTNPYVDVYCSGHNYLGDGRVIAIGGHIRDFVGSDVVSMFDWRTRRWDDGPRMSAGRWYPTTTVLGNGDLLAVSGDVDTTVGVNRLPQVLEGSTGAWRDLTNAQLGMPLYPWMHLAPNGKVFNSGPGQTTRYLDTAGSGAWTTVALTNFGDRLQYQGTSVMYEPGKVLILGGGNPATATAEVINLSDASPKWRYTNPMSWPRREPNATLLPDGKVLVTGGHSAELRDPRQAVYNAEIWDPASETWSTMAPMKTSRLYHSTAVLLPDGRVLVTGGGGDGSAGDIDHYDAEYFSPPYLFKGARPTIEAAPANIAYGQDFALAASDAAGITGITLVALSSTTHEFNQSQRFVRLSFSPGAQPGSFSVASPSQPNLAPPGYYMLFVLNGNGVPSVARMVLVGSGAGGNEAPSVSAGADQTITLPGLASLSGSASDDGKPGPLTTTWSRLSGPGSVSFANPASPATTAGFSMPGAYVLRLSANDGAATSVDDVALTVNAAPGATGSGLTAKYYNGTSFESLALTRIDPTVDFTWGYESPGAGVQADGFSARWSGQILAPVSGNYTFSTVSNDGVRLWVNGQRIINNWTVHGTTTDHSAPLALVAGTKYSVTMEFFENSGWGKAQLFWSYPGQAQVIVPQSQLYPDAPPPNQAPSVNAGADQAITLPAAAVLAGSASDDGQPGALTTLWSKLSGPGTVSFGNASIPGTTASFSAPGDYVLRLSAHDGLATSIDDLAVRVNAAPGAAGSGLSASYYNGMSFNSVVFTRVDPTVDFTWGYNSPGDGVQADGFSVRWSGQILAPVTGSYVFSTVSNDGVRLWVNGRRIINNWTVHGTTTDRSASVALVAGTRYRVTMEFFENSGWGKAQLFWAYPGQAQVIIPQSHLFPASQ